ncbi:unnamed protein product [Microthlaspi erraticum]|uniref:Uncharacterized protein n=1 Tax=Microthlaspi erraticum TaxID=1685480 RepID=A0A6D2ILW8_9BRAS|nr:unnamed protein product [Microthlaspi erraticum]
MSITNDYVCPPPSSATAPPAPAPSATPAPVSSATPTPSSALDTPTQPQLSFGSPVPDTSRHRSVIYKNPTLREKIKMLFCCEGVTYDCESPDSSFPWNLLVFIVV